VLTAAASSLGRRPASLAESSVEVEAARTALGQVPSRVAGIGGGADLLSGVQPAFVDVPYPPSLNGTWVCQRSVISVEGDRAQAEGAWRLLGGDGDIRQPEAYSLRFVDQPSRGVLSITGVDGKKYFGVVLDRGFELNSRSGGAAVSWDRRTPDILTYSRSVGGRESTIELNVVQRSVELPSEQGWGSNELLRITTDGGAIFGKINYAVRIQRRFRRANDGTGGRAVEGLELVRTYRVLDGIAGVEYPTSTIKSTIRLLRPAAN